MGSGESPKQCMVCDICGTTLLKNADGIYMEAIPHSWTTEEIYRDSKLIKTKIYCKWCHDSKSTENI